ncbi:hypothetical protein Q8A67_007786 [Cirrhinus molitorella]|uniref:Uncharacterized protein n=1 Tax=Cirrhinus molitorella TaxID=172907 RepID=A0AA88PVI2_9TELE|nr:hypothetical protein Q8A67_007786 [Cirrhinus molitorella]
MGGGWALGCGQGGGLGGDEVRLLLTLFSPWGALGCRISVQEMRIRYVSRLRLLIYSFETAVARTAIVVRNPALKSGI